MEYTIKKIAPYSQEHTDPWVVFDANNNIVNEGQTKEVCEWYVDDMLNRKGHWFTKMIPHYFGKDWDPATKGQPKFFPTPTAEQSYNKCVELYEIEHSMPRGAERRAIANQGWDSYCVYKKELEDYLLEETA